MTATSDNMAVDVAVIKEQLRSIAQDMQEARAARKAQYEQNERQSETLLKIEHRLQTVETFVTESRPTLQEYRDLKNKVAGAGWMGRWLYVLAGASIGFAASVFGYWRNWFGS